MDSGFTEFDCALRDGRTVHVRGMRPADEAELVQAFGRMSDDARYMRFMRLVREPNVERLRSALASLPETGMGIVATVPAADGFDIVGSTVYFVGNDRKTCEFAINVAVGFGGVGLARTLLTALIHAAKARGLKEMDGFVLAMNQPMLRLARRLGFRVESDPEDRAVCICRLNLAQA